MSDGEGRYRLTITVSTDLLRELREHAGARKISYWLEEAAWRRIRAERDRDLVGIGGLVDVEEDLADLGISPKWSALAD